MPNIFEAIAGIGQMHEFKLDPVDDKLIGVLLHMATQALSAGNVQEWRFIVIKNLEQKDKLYRAALKQDPIREAPVVIAVCADLHSISLKYEKRGEVLYASQDASFCTQNILLGAYGLGLSTFVARAFDEERVRSALILPENIRPFYLVAVGYGARAPEKLDRNLFDNITWTEKWGEKYEISYVIQTGPHRDMRPIGNIIEDKLRDITQKSNKKMTFKDFLKKLRAK